MKPHLLLNELKALEDDWNLPGSNAPCTTRTRWARKVTVAEEPIVEVLDEDNENEEEEEEEDEEEEEAEEQPRRRRKSTKPSHTRVILEVAHLEKAFSEFACPKCNDLSIEVKLQTVCIATRIGLSCSNEECDYIFQPELPVARTLVHEQDDEQFQDKVEWSTDYAVNVLYVLGFMSMGDAHSEAARLLGLLGLPNDTTMKTRSFSIIMEQRIGPFMRKLNEEEPRRILW
jgi:hypothetical protein